MKIAIMSDSHDNFNALETAINMANKENCELLLFAGDLISPPGVAVLEKFDKKVIFVWGNNESEKMGITRKMDSTEKIELAGGFYEDEVDGVKIFMNHYPKFVELAAKSGDYDLVIHGHTHEFREETFGDTLLINPGEIMGYLSGESTFVIFETKDRSYKKITIE